MKSNKLGYGYQRKLALERHTEEFEIIGNNLKTARIKRCFSVAELAYLANVNRSTIYHIENGKPTISLFSFFSVLKALDLYEDVKNIIVLDIHGNEIFQRKILVKNAIKHYKV
ncbi:MAG: helix-turn-helix domain-containing protein [Sediminibacterium sp.]|nr:helix-turn-helix domain-containing protein [Sediminibacterium sp.]MBP6144655.1 helix-turn-helix domain-containing protein [Sediminibacterium sp.]